MRNKLSLFLLLLLQSIICFAGDTKISEEAILPEQSNEPEAWQNFKTQYGKEWQYKENSSGIPSIEIFGGRLPIEQKISEKNVPDIVVNKIEQLQNILNINMSDMVLMHIDSITAETNDNSSGNWHLYYIQQYHNIDIENSFLHVDIRNGNITRIFANYHADLEMDTKPTVFRNKLKKLLPSANLTESNIEQAQLKILAQQTNAQPIYTLAWVVDAEPGETIEHIQHHVSDNNNNPDKQHFETQQIPAQWRYIVHAHNGSILKRINLLDYSQISGQVEGSIREKRINQPAVKKKIPNLRISLTQGAINQRTNTNKSGDYKFENLAEGQAQLKSTFENDHIVIDNSSTNPDATHNALLTPPSVHNWDWSIDDPSPNDVETNAFYHVNFIRDWFLRGAPFDIQPTPLRMQVSVRHGNYCNASAGPLGLYFGSGNGKNCKDYAMCADIIYHEYTHRITRTLFSLNGTPTISPHFGALNEAWSDYFAASIVNDPDNGATCSIYPRNIDTPNHNLKDDWVGDNHEDSRIFSGALWDMRKTLGASYSDKLAMLTLRQTPLSFDIALRMLLEQDDDPSVSNTPNKANNKLADGSPNIKTICSAFVDNHLIFDNACVGHTNNSFAMITSPDPNAYNLQTKTTNSLDINGVVFGSTSEPFSHYKLEYASASKPNIWSNTGITLANNGRKEVKQTGLLGKMDISNLADGSYTIKLTAYMNSTRTLTTSFVIDKSQKKGWPARPNSHFTSSPAIADIDPKTKGLEIVNRDDNGVLFVWHSDGSIMKGWPLNIGTGLSSPAVGDLDGNGDFEVVILNDDGLVNIFNHDGSYFYNSRMSTSGYGESSTTVLYDLDNDGDLEIIVGSTDGDTHVWHHDGKTMAGWPAAGNQKIVASPAVGDIDGDGKPEIVIARNLNGWVEVYDTSGNHISGWPKQVPSVDRVSYIDFLNSPAIGDIDADGDREIIIASNGYDEADKKIHVWHHDGTYATGWPKRIKDPNSSVRGADFFVPTSIVLGNIDNDDQLEIIAQSAHNNVFVLEHDGKMKTGWPSLNSGNARSYEFFPSSPVVADLDGDGDKELFTDGGPLPTLASQNGVFAYHDDGKNMSGWPKNLPTPNNSTAAIADIDRDGLTDIVLGAQGMVVWDTKGKYSKHQMEWPTFRHNNHRTGTYTPASSVVLAFDTSGSMRFSPQGNFNAKQSDWRLTLSQSAAKSFVDLYDKFLPKQAGIGISKFPGDADCDTKTLMPVSLLTNSSKNKAKNTIIPSLQPDAYTPLLGGIKQAASMLSAEQDKVIVLLSDGVHNCPSNVKLNSKEVNEVIALLKAKSIRLYTIAFGHTSEVDKPMLQKLAQDSRPAGSIGSQYFDATLPGFKVQGWDPATALQSVYKSVLTGALGLQSAKDPLNEITGGSKKAFNISLNKPDEKAVFFLSWKTSQKNRLNLKLTSSDGQTVSLNDPAVSIVSEKTYKVVSIAADFLNKPGKVGSTPWKFEVNANNIASSQKEQFQYSVLVDSDLTLDAGTEQAIYQVGDKIKVLAKLSEFGKPVTGIQEARVEITTPSEGKGNWLSKHHVDKNLLNQIQLHELKNNSNMAQLKSQYLMQINNVLFPEFNPAQTLKLYDDGTHGDSVANDGIYSNEFPNTPKEGTYTFHFKVNGTSISNNSFARDQIVQKHLSVKPVTQHTLVEIEELDQTDSTLIKQIKITPKDNYDNYLGAGFAHEFSIKDTNAEVLGNIEDTIDGSYLLTVEVDKKQAANIAISLFDMELNVTLNEPTDNRMLIILLITIILLLALLLLVKRDKQ